MISTVLIIVKRLTALCEQLVPSGHPLDVLMDQVGYSAEISAIHHDVAALTVLNQFRGAQQLQIIPHRLFYTLQVTLQITDGHNLLLIIHPTVVLRQLFRLLSRSCRAPNVSRLSIFSALSIPLHLVKSSFLSSLQHALKLRIIAAGLMQNIRCKTQAGCCSKVDDILFTASHDNNFMLFLFTIKSHRLK